MKIFGIYGWSGSGKTDVICRLINFLTRKEIKISSIKHTHHNISVDKRGKDSFQHRESGAKEVIVGGKQNWALIHNGEKDENNTLDDLLEKFSSEVDLVLVEGFKKSKIPKIEVYNSNLKKIPISLSDENTLAIIYDKIDKKIVNSTLPKFNFNDTERIAKFILNYLKIDDKK
tara:strand:- start:288 stop:806 length:519 start_codon:yes stop_codon:yes gene_type:complete